MGAHAFAHQQRKILYLQLRVNTELTYLQKNGKLNFDRIAAAMNLEASLQAGGRKARLQWATARINHHDLCKSMLASGTALKELPKDLEGHLPIGPLRADELLLPKNPYVVKNFEAELQRARDATVAEAQGAAIAGVTGLLVQQLHNTGKHHCQGICDIGSLDYHVMD